MGLTKIQFDRSQNVDFYKTLQKRVRDYFKENNISKYANANMVIKSFFMLALFLTPWALMTFYFESTGMLMLMWCIMGMGTAGIGLSIMHDANHGSYSKNKLVNNFFSGCLYLVGGSPINWRIQHNVLHHTYTNVTGMDEDIDPGKLMRFSPHEPRYKAHRFQHIYAWFFYGFMTIAWVTTKDFKQLFRYKKLGLTQTQSNNFGKLLMELILSKLAYYAVILVLPLIFSDMSWWAIVLCFLLQHFIAGFILGCIFQPAHVVPSSNYPLPDDSGNIKADWAVSQLFNTANFAPKNKILSWYVGGLNFQVEHHLFPNICHVHYPKLANIVKKTAEEFNLPYNSEKTFTKALLVHGKMLYRLGNYDTLQPS